MDLKRFQIQFYKNAAQYFQLYSITLAAMTSGWIFLVLLPFHSSAFFANVCFYIIVPTIIILFLFVWMTVWGWYFTWFRYITYFVAKLSFWMRKFLSNWMTSFFLFFVIASLIQSRQLLLFNSNLSLKKFLKEFVDYRSIIETLLIVFLIIVVDKTLKARKRLVISRFNNLTGIQELDFAVKSIGPRILTDLRRLSDLLCDIEDIYRKRKRSGLIETTVNIQDIGKNLTEMIGPQSRLEIGSFLKIPIDLIYASFISLIQGRVLKGDLHLNGDKLILTAHLKGKEFNECWQVDCEHLELPAPSSQTEMLVKMTEELVLRVFTVIAKETSPRWRAVKHYTEGLRFYRETVSAELHRKINLLRARDAFIASLKEDDRFAQLYYNLGIVYFELGNHNAAETIFRKGLTKDADNFDCYFKLALLYYFNKKEPQDVRWFCGEARAISPRHPYPWNLLGVSLFGEWKEKHPEFNNGEVRKSSLDITRENTLEVDRDIIIFFRNASVFAWKRLCRSLKKGAESKKEKNGTAICLLNLAIAIGRRNRPFTGPIFKQSLFLVPHDNEVYYNLGKYYYRLGKIKKSYKAFIRVFQEDNNVDTIRFWALYSNTCAKLFKKYEEKRKTARNRKISEAYKQVVENNYIHFLNAASDYVQDSLPRPSSNDKDHNAYNDKKNNFHINQELMKEALSNINEKGKEELIHSLGALKMKVIEINNNPTSPDSIKEKIENYRKENGHDLFEDTDWCLAQIKIAGGKKFIGESDPRIIKKGLSNLADAVEFLHSKFALQLKRQNIGKYIARGSFNSGEYKTALFHARNALRNNPFGADELHLLGDIYFKLNDCEAGFEAWKNGFNLDPPGRDRIEQMGETCVGACDRLGDADLRSKMCNRVIEFLLQMKKLMENYPLSDNPDQCPPYVNQLEAIHYYVGYFYGELLQFDRAVYHLRIASKLIDKNPRGHNRLGWTYYDMKMIDRAQESFQLAKNVLDEQEREKKEENKEKGTNDKRLAQKAETCLGLALCRISRESSDIGIESLDSLLKEAHTSILNIDNNKDKNRLLALYHECQGQRALKNTRSRIPLKAIIRKRYKDSIKFFEQSIAFKPTPRVCYYTATTYWEYAQQVNHKKKEQLIQKAWKAANLCSTYDTRRQYNGNLEKMIAPPESALI